MAEMAFARHMLAYVAPHIWEGVMAGESDPVLLRWADKGWPAIVRRPDCSDHGHAIPLGLPLPPSMGKRRVALRCDADAILRISAPPLLRDAASAAPAAWQIAIAALLILNPQARCFGSLAWAYLTGLPYLTTTSDLDLILAVDDPATAGHIARELASIAGSAPMAIDAELTAPSGAAVQWREWHSGARTLIVKSMDGATLVQRETLFA